MSFPIGFDAVRFDRGGPFVCGSTVCTIRPPQQPLPMIIEQPGLYVNPFAATFETCNVVDQWRLIGYCVALQPICADVVQPIIIEQQCDDKPCQAACNQGRCRKNRGNEWTPRSSYSGIDYFNDHHHHDQHHHKHHNHENYRHTCRGGCEQVQIVQAIPQQQCRTRRYRLYARRSTCSSGWQYAVTEEGVQNAIVILLAPDPRACSSARDGYRCRRTCQEELQSGDTIFIPGEPTMFVVHAYNDDWRY
jgi:hypothetical protein